MPRGYSIDLIERVYHKTHGQCWYCSADISPFGNWEVEHQTPKCQGGTDDLANLVAACRECNREKAGRNVEQYRTFLHQRAIMQATEVLRFVANIPIEELGGYAFDMPLTPAAKVLQQRIERAKVYFWGEREYNFRADSKWIGDNPELAEWTYGAYMSNKKADTESSEVN